MAKVKINKTEVPCEDVLQIKMVMVSDNTDHLGRIRGIEIENWKIDEPKV